MMTTRWKIEFAVVAVVLSSVISAATVGAATRVVQNGGSEPLHAVHDHSAIMEKLPARTLLHEGIDHGSESDSGSGRSYQWLKWVAGAVLLVEGLLGVLIPVMMKATVHAGWLLTIINCFAAAVFFSFGVLHLAPDALGAQDNVGLTRFPLAAFLVGLAFFIVFFLHRILAPALRLKPHLAASQTPDFHVARSVAAPTAVAGCSHCGDNCGCAGGVGAGNCGLGCQAGACQCAQRKKGPDVARDLENVRTADVPAGGGFGFSTAAMAASIAPVGGCGHCEDTVSRTGCGAGAVALIPPVLILLGLLAHTVLEGLVIGLQKSYADVVTAFVAMASHKWVESIAVAAAFMAAGSGMVAIIGFLIPFSLGPLIGIAIGVSVSDSNTWATLVLFSLVAGLFIYVGSLGIVAEEFSKFDDPAFAATRPRGARFYMFAAMLFGFTVVSLLQLVPEAG